MNRRLLACIIVWASVTGAMALVPGCYGRNCEGTGKEYGREPGQGQMIDENTWESSPMNSTWLHFGGQSIYYFDVPALGDRVPYAIHTYISPAPAPFVYGPDAAPNNAAPGGGNLTEISGVDRNRFAVRNGTCAEYYLRVVVEVAPKPDGVIVLPVDGGDDAGDAGDAGDVGDASDAGDPGDGGDAEAG